MTLPSDGRVVQLRPRVTMADFKVGEPPRSSSLGALGNLAHWVRGRGRCLVPQHACNTALAAGGSTTQHYKVRPSGTAIARVWIGEARQTSWSGTGTAGYAVQAGSGPTATGIASNRSAPGNLFVYIEPCTKTSAVTDLQFFFGGNVSSAMTLITLGCWELPRAALARGGTDLGLSLDSFGPRRPMYEDTAEGPFALATLAAALTTHRGTLVASWVDKGLQTTSATYVDCYALPISLVPPKDKATDTTRTCIIDVYGKVSAAATVGNVLVKDAAGALSAAISISSTTPAWCGTVTKTFKCEDLSTSDGVPGSGIDTVQLQVKRASGAGTVVVYGWVLYT